MYKSYVLYISAYAGLATIYSADNARKTSNLKSTYAFTSYPEMVGRGKTLDRREEGGKCIKRYLKFTHCIKQMAVHMEKDNIHKYSEKANLAVHRFQGK